MEGRSTWRNRIQCLPKGNPSRMRENCWSRGQKVSVLLGLARVECRPSSAPPISLTPVLLRWRKGAISSIAHCSWGWSWLRMKPMCLWAVDPEPWQQQRHRWWCRSFRDWIPAGSAWPQARAESLVIDDSSAESWVNSNLRRMSLPRMVWNGSLMLASGPAINRLVLHELCRFVDPVA